jgi:hypothetical protein
LLFKVTGSYGKALVAIKIQGCYEKSMVAMWVNGYNWNH